MGVMTAYHLRQANLAVDFLVKPARLAASPASYRLYSYDDGKTHVLENFGVFANPSSCAIWSFSAKCSRSHAMSFATP